MIILARWLLYREKPQAWERAAVFVAGYGLIGLSALLYAAYAAPVQETLITFIKDAIIAIAVVILINRAVTLHRVIWTLLIAGILMGTITSFQYVTGTFHNNYWGLGQAQIYYIVGETNDYRAGGPGFGPNAYGQFMLVLVPLALDRFWQEQKPFLRILAGWALAATTLAVVFSFSRGAFLGLIVVLAIMFIRRPPAPLIMLLTILIAALLLRFIPPEYTARLATLTELLPADQKTIQDGSFRGRLSENISGWRMFTDRPFLGVGLGNFRPYYQEYSRTLGLDQRREARAPHSLYLEIVSEMGLVGLAWFAALMWVLFSGLLQARRDFLKAGMPDYASMSTTLAVSLLSLLITGIFLHSAHPRHYWLLYGIIFAAPHVAKRELRPALRLLNSQEGNRHDS